MKVGLSPYIGNHSPEDVNIYNEKIAKTTVIWIKQISNSYHDALSNYQKDNTYIQKNIWYADSLLKACQEAKQPKMFDWVKTGNKQILGYLPPKFFDKIPAPNTHLKFRKWEFIVKPDVLPSAALKAAFAGLSIIDCGMAVKMTYYATLLDLFGEEKFNRLFGSSENGEKMKISYLYDTTDPLEYFTDFTEAANTKVSGKMGDRPVKVGQTVGFEGVKDFDKKKFFGFWASTNVICSDATAGNQKFISMGMNPEGSIEKQINQHLLDKYNCEEDPFLLQEKGMPPISAFLYKLTNKIVATEVGGYVPGTPRALIPEIIMDIVKMPLEQVSMDFVRRHPLNANRS